MAVKHTKVATTADDGTSEVGTNEWNDNHTIDNSTITNDHLAGSIANGKLATDPLARANHTGSQAASTVSDFDTEVANNSAVTANTAKISYSTAASNAVAANTAKTGITTGQASAITANTAKVGLTNDSVDSQHYVDASIDSAHLSSGLTIADPTLTYSINAQTGTTYTSVLADAGKIITTSNGSAIAVTIPPNSSVAYPIGSSLTIISIGAGLTTIGQGAGVTINSTGAVATAPVLRIAHSSATAIKIATDTWQVVGDIA
tara:strand:+ start:95 stop:877 length:783 start_codon:yes stop_codon:yes gene_type:complete